MHQESKAILQKVLKPIPLKVGKFKAYRFTVSDRECILVECGWGMFRAAEATRQFISAFHPSYLISFGIAGAVQADLNIGDLVVAGDSYLLEDKQLAKHKPIARLSSECVKSIESSLSGKGVRLVHGVAITTRGSQLTASEVPMLTHPVLEMETAGIVDEANEAGISLISLRAISDGPVAPIPFDLGKMINPDYSMKIGKILLEVLRHPKILTQGAKIQRNSQFAAEIAALATLAVLSVHDPVQFSQK